MSYSNIISKAMKLLILIISCGFTLAASNPHLQMVVPEVGIAGENIWGHCIAEGKIHPRIAVVRSGDYRCNSKKLVKKFVTVDQNRKYYSRADFVIENVTTTCAYKCWLYGSYVIRTVSIVGRWI